MRHGVFPQQVFRDFRLLHTSTQDGLNLLGQTLGVRQAGRQEEHQN
jgi:hypothetical protein